MVINSFIENVVLKYDDISDFLGNHKSRYLSNGFKNVTRVIKDLELDTETGGITGTGVLNYAGDWSTKSNKKRTDAHLSTIDIAILSLKIMECLFSRMLKLNQNQISRSWVRSIEMSFSNDAFEELENVPLSGNIISTTQNRKSICGHISLIEFIVGNAKVTMEVDHPLFGAPRFPTREQTVIRIDNDYFGGNYREKAIFLSDVTCYKDEKRSTAAVNFDFSPHFESHSGAIGSYSSACNVLDMIMLGGQMAQFSIFINDNISREEANNLWVRKINVRLNEPVYLTGEVRTINTISNDRHIRQRDNIWSVVESHLTIDGNRGYFTGDFVHLLPKKEEVK